MKKKELIKKLNQDIDNLKLEIKLHEIKDKYVEKSKDSKCLITALANTFECAAEIAQAIKDKEPVIVGEKETERILNSFSHTHEDDLKELVRSSKELSNKTTITIPNKPQGTKDLEIVLKSGQSYSIENNSGCEVNVKFE